MENILPQASLIVNTPAAGKSAYVTSGGLGKTFGHQLRLRAKGVNGDKMPRAGCFRKASKPVAPERGALKRQCVEGLMGASSRQLPRYCVSVANVSRWRAPVCSARPCPCWMTQALNQASIPALENWVEPDEDESIDHLTVDHGSAKYYLQNYLIFAAHSIQTGSAETLSAPRAAGDVGETYRRSRSHGAHPRPRSRNHAIEANAIDLEFGIATGSW